MSTDGSRSSSKLTDSSPLSSPPNGEDRGSIAQPSTSPSHPQQPPNGPTAQAQPVNPALKEPYKAPGYNAKVVSALGLHFVEQPYDTFVEKFATPAAATSKKEDKSRLATAERKDAEPANSATRENVIDLDLPTEVTEQLAAAAEKLKPLLDGGKEEPMYAPLCASFNAALAKISPEKYAFRIVSDHPESGRDDLKIDIAMYDRTKAAKAAYELPRGSRKDRARTAWAWIKCGIEVKYDPSASAFSFHDTKHASLLGKNESATAQIVKYATEMMIRQHRSFVFIIYIFRDKFRLTRWDRAGCIVTAPVDFGADPAKLLSFIYRLSLMSEEELGYDTKFKLAPEKEIKVFEDDLHDNPYAGSLANEILGNRVLFPIYKVTCPNLRVAQSGNESSNDSSGEGEGEITDDSLTNDSTGESTYYIGIHNTASYSPIGRATKGYVAFRKGSRYLAFLKTYWRAVGVTSELRVYEELARHRVPYVARALGGGDTRGKGTVTQEYLNIKNVAERVQCIVVIEQLAKPLKYYKDSLQLISIVYQALRGHEAAYVKAGVLHRDVSTHNIMILVNQGKPKKEDEVEGLLMDWDLSKLKSELGKGAKQHGRSGTWAFMSALSLQYPYKPNTLADDLESFIHVVTYNCLQFHRHDKTTVGTPGLPLDVLAANNGKNARLARFVSNLLDECDKDGSDYIGGTVKLAFNQSGNPGFTFFNPISPHLPSLVKKLYQLLKEFYASYDSDEYQQYRPLRQVLQVACQDPQMLPKPAGVARPPKSDVFDSHDRIIGVFDDVCQALMAERAQQKERDGTVPTLEDKTDDQFFGLPGYVLTFPKNSSGSKRPSDPTGDSSAKRLKLQESEGTGSGLQGIPEI